MADQVDLEVEQWRAARPDPDVSAVAVVRAHDLGAPLPDHLETENHVLAALSPAERTLRSVLESLGEGT